MERLPLEVEENILSFLMVQHDDIASLLNCRLVKRSWASITARHAFSHVVLCPNAITFQRAKAISSHPTYRHFVKTVHVDVSVMPDELDFAGWKGEVQRFLNPVEHPQDGLNDGLPEAQLRQMYIKWVENRLCQTAFMTLTLDECVAKFKELRQSLPNLQEIFIHSGPQSKTRGVPHNIKQQQCLILPRPSWMKPILGGPEVASFERELDDFVTRLIQACLTGLIDQSPGRYYRLHFDRIEADSLAWAEATSNEVKHALSKITEVSVATPSDDNGVDDGRSWDERYDDIIEIVPAILAVYVHFSSHSFPHLTRLSLENVNCEFPEEIKRKDLVLAQVHALRFSQAYLQTEDFEVFCGGHHFPRLRKLRVCDSEYVQHCWPMIWHWLSSNHGGVEISWEGTLADSWGLWSFPDHHSEDSCGHRCALKEIAHFTNGTGQFPSPIPEIITNIGARDSMEECMAKGWEEIFDDDRCVSFVQFASVKEQRYDELRLKHRNNNVLNMRRW